MITVSELLKSIEKEEDTIYLLVGSIKIQQELLDYFVDLDEDDRPSVIKELKELEYIIQAIFNEIIRDLKKENSADEHGETEILPLIASYSPFNFNALNYVVDYEEIAEILETFDSERKDLINWLKNFKFKELDVNDKIKIYLISKRQIVKEFQNKLKSINVLMKRLRASGNELNSTEQAFIIVDSLRILKTITMISLNYIIEKWEIAKRVYSIFRDIHFYFLELALNDKELKSINEISPLFDELPNEEFDKEKNLILEKFVRSIPLMFLKKNVSTDQLLLAVEYGFSNYQNRLKKFLNFDERVIFKSVSPYEKIKEKFKRHIDGLFIENVSHALYENPLGEYNEVNEWSFEFVIHNEFRKVIERDFEELKVNLAAGCVKSSIVLIGGILEAILFDLFYDNDNLIREKFEKKYPQEKYLYSRTKFQWLAEAAKRLGIINDDLRKMCELIWNLRNNVHSMKEIEGIEVSKQFLDAVVPLMTTVIRNLERNIEKYRKTIHDKITRIEIDIKEIVNDN